MTRDEAKKKATAGKWQFRGGFICTDDSQGEPVIIAGMLRHGKRMFCEVHHSPFGGFQNGYFYATEQQDEANRMLIIEAGQVAMETGMWPRDLMERIRQLEAIISPEHQGPCPHSTTRKVPGRPEWCVDCNTEL
jgi:hypothetical protein